MLLLSTAILATAILIAIFAFGRKEVAPPEVKDYTEDIRALNDTILKLQRNIEEYERRIALIDLERENLKQEIQEILKQNEKTDSIIVSNNLDANVRYLTDYLTKSGGYDGRYPSVYYSRTSDDNQQGPKP